MPLTEQLRQSLADHGSHVVPGAVMLGPRKRDISMQKLIDHPGAGGYDKAAHDSLMSQIHDLLDRHLDIDGADIEGG